MANTKLVAGMTVTVLAIILGIVALVTPEWTTADVGELSVGIFRGALYGTGFSIDPSDCVDSGGQCEATQATAAFAIIAILLGFFGLCFAGARLGGKSAGSAKLPMALLLAATLSNLLAVIIYAAAVYATVSELATLGYSWGLLIGAAIFNGIGAALVN